MPPPSSDHPASREPELKPRWVALAWSVPGVVSALQYTVLCPFPTPPDVDWFGLRAFVASVAMWQGWALLTPLVWRWLRRHPLPGSGARPWAMHLGLALPLAVIHVVWVIWCRQWMFGEPLGDFPALRKEFGLSLQSRLLLELAIYAAVVAAAEAWRQRGTAARRGARLHELEGELARAQLAALRAQLQPHFLFNALNAVAVLARAGENAAAATVVTDLSELLRRSLETGATALVSLREEMEFSTRFLAIEQRRYGADRLRFRCELAPEALAAQVPGLLLQPILENAVKHGVTQRTGAGGCVRIDGRQEQGRLVLEVSDNGPGRRSAGAGGHGIGLANVRERLRRLYAAGEYRFDCGDAASGGYRVRIELPFQPTAAACAS